MTDGRTAVLALMESERDRITSVCRRFHVRRLELFGSAATGEFDPERSDIDLLVEFVRDAPQRALDGYFGLKEELEALLGRPIDLVGDSAIVNPYLRSGIDQSRKLVYAA